MNRQLLMIMGATIALGVAATLMQHETFVVSTVVDSNQYDAMVAELKWDHQNQLCGLGNGMQYIKPNLVRCYPD